MSEPVRLGQYAVDSDEEGNPVPRAAEGDDLCSNCFHALVCAVPTAIKQLAGQITVGTCEHHLAIQELTPSQR